MYVSTAIALCIPRAFDLVVEMMVWMVLMVVMLMRLVFPAANRLRQTPVTDFDLTPIGFRQNRM